MIHNRRDFIKSLFGIWIMNNIPLSFGAAHTTPSLLITQIQDRKRNKFEIIFMNLDTMEVKVLPVPYMIHSILPIRNNSEFILTAKGAYIFHVTKDKIISKRRCPDDLVFYGHSTFLEKENKLLTSAADIKGYDFSPIRAPKKMVENDPHYGRGHILEFALNDLVQTGSFLSGANFPHDQRIFGKDELLVLNFEQEGKQDSVPTLIDLKTRSPKTFFSCENGDVCSIAHMFGKNDKLAMLGISKEATVVFMEGGKLRKAPLNTEAQQSYTWGEMLNASFNDDGSRLCGTNIDNNFIGLWDVNTGKLLKYQFDKEMAVSVTTYGGMFIVMIGKELRYYDFDLNLKKRISLEQMGIQNRRFFGPHSTLS